MLPTAFPLLGHRITVRVVPPDEWQHGEDTVGIWVPTEYAIEINGGVQESMRGHTFFHELLHAALDQMNHKLARNEQFVDSLAGLLHQALTGAEYPKPKRRKRA